MSTPSDAQTADLRALRRQATVLEGIARGVPLSETLNRLALSIESESNEALCGICVIDPQRLTVTESFGPNLPAHFRESLRGARLGDLISGPCAHAARSQETIVVEDVAADPRWARSPWSLVCLEEGFRSSSPVRLLTREALWWERSRSITARPSRRPVRRSARPRPISPASPSSVTATRLPSGKTASGFSWLSKERTWARGTGILPPTPSSGPTIAGACLEFRKKPR